jgi:hypothetical protein
MLSSASSLLFLSGLIQVVTCSNSRLASRDGPSPALPYDDGTTKYCPWWMDYRSTRSCSDIFSENAINLEAFRRWVCFAGVTHDVAFANLDKEPYNLGCV